MASQTAPIGSIRSSIQREPYFTHNDHTTVENSFLRISFLSSSYPSFLTLDPRFLLSIIATAPVQVLLAGLEDILSIHSSLLLFYKLFAFDCVNCHCPLCRAELSPSSPAAENDISTLCTPFRLTFDDFITTLLFSPSRSRSRQIDISLSLLRSFGACITALLPLNDTVIVLFL